jgi:hypothetical protein
MDNKTTFIRFLSNEYSIDYWSDVAIEQAIELANVLPPADWISLTSDWESLTQLCQARLAQISSEISADTPSVIQMLVAMLSSSDSEVVEASLDSLNSICQLSPERLEKLDLRQALTNVKPVGKTFTIVLESLKRRLTQKPNAG